MTSRISSLINREPVTLAETATVRDAALVMGEERVSSLLITESDGGAVIGMVTETDLRERVLAAGLSYERPVAEIMSGNLPAIDARRHVFEAVPQMLRQQCEHLAVVRDGELLGVVGLADLARYEFGQRPLVVDSIFRQETVEDLALLHNEVRASFLRMVDEGARSEVIGGAMAWIGRSFKQRLLKLGEEKLGPPPVPYCFIALGSMARDEQSIVTDQDNAIILSDRFDHAEHDAYFVSLAEWVCDGLAACGYSYCTGGIMATNREWRQPLNVWLGYFSEWIENPAARARVNSRMFFDLDGVWGNTELSDQLNAVVRRKARESSRFVLGMARDALGQTPGPDLFRRIAKKGHGERSKPIDIKRQGTTAFSDLIRVYAMAIGSGSRNSFARLQDVIAAEIVPTALGHEVRDALELMSTVRIRHQARAIAEGRQPDNYIDLERLSNFERQSLKEAFRILSNAHNALGTRYSL